MSASPALAVESPTVAGPIGGTDIRSAMLPPPGLYLGIGLLGAATVDFRDANGHTVPALRDAQLSKEVVAPSGMYVPDWKVLGGSVAVGGYVPLVNTCGHLVASLGHDCDTGVGDPYIEFNWSRFFGTVRSSKYSDAYPIMEGLNLAAGIGIVLPIGQFTAPDALRQALSPGSRIWDFAPTVGLTYTTPPIIAEGTELSVRLYWNNYLENPATHYTTGDIIDIDFALTEHIGPLQIGIAGLLATQIEDDQLFGATAPPDGRQAEVFGIGGVASYDFPSEQSSVKLKATTTAPHAENTVANWSATMTWFKKF